MPRPRTPGRPARLRRAPGHAARSPRPAGGATLTGICSVAVLPCRARSQGNGRGSDAWSSSGRVACHPPTPGCEGCHASVPVMVQDPRVAAQPSAAASGPAGGQPGPVAAGQCCWPGTAAWTGWRRRWRPAGATSTRCAGGCATVRGRCGAAGRLGAGPGTGRGGLLHAAAGLDPVLDGATGTGGLTGVFAHMFRAQNADEVGCIGGPTACQRPLGVSSGHRQAWNPDGSSPMGGHRGFNVLRDGESTRNQGVAGSKQAL